MVSFGVEFTFPHIDLSLLYLDWHPYLQLAIACHQTLFFRPFCFSGVLSVLESLAFSSASFLRTANTSSNMVDRETVRYLELVVPCPLQRSINWPTDIDGEGRGS